MLLFFIRMRWLPAAFIVIPIMLMFPNISSGIRRTDKFPTESVTCRNNIARRPEFYELLEQMCFSCHEMYNHRRRQLRYRCRRDCFQNKVFRFCSGHWLGRKQDHTFGTTTFQPFPRSTTS